MVEKFKTYLKRYYPQKYFKKSFSSGYKAIVIVLFSLFILTLVIYSNMKTIIVTVDGNSRKITTFSDTYGKALSNNNIIVGPKDEVSVNLDGKILNGTKISINRAVNVEIDVDGKKIRLQSAEDNIGKLLSSVGISVKDSDRIQPSKDEKLSDGLKVDITRVEIKDIKEVKPIDYTTVVKSDDSIEPGSQKVIQEGQPGEKENTIKITYENGKEISRKVVSEIVKKQPMKKIIAMGTLNLYTPSRGDSISYGNSMRMKSTAYTAGYESTGKVPGDPDYGVTTTGTIARRVNNSYSSVAVDPRVVPLGTKLYVEGYGYAIAEDTGGAIKGNRIDLFFNSDEEANNWGVKWVNVYVIK